MDQTVNVYEIIGEKVVRMTAMQKVINTQAARITELEALLNGKNTVADEQGRGASEVDLPDDIEDRP